MSGYPETLPSVSLFLKWSSFGHGNVDRIITETCAALPLEQLVLLDVSSIYRMEQQTWLNAFGNLERLRSIRVHGDSIHTLLSAMIADPGTATGTSVSANSSTQRGSPDRGATPPAVYFPSLLSLTLEDLSFDEERNELYTELNALKNCLTERFERKAGVRELTLNQCRRLSKQTVKELEEIVVNVTWDGLEMDFTDYSEDEDDYDDSDS